MWQAAESEQYTHTSYTNLPLNLLITHTQPVSPLISAYVCVMGRFKCRLSVSVCECVCV